MAARTVSVWVPSRAALPRGARARGSEARAASASTHRTPDETWAATLARATSSSPPTPARRQASAPRAAYSPAMGSAAASANRPS